MLRGTSNPFFFILNQYSSSTSTTQDESRFRIWRNTGRTIQNDRQALERIILHLAGCSTKQALRAHHVGAAAGGSWRNGAVEIFNQECIIQTNDGVSTSSLHWNWSGPLALRVKRNEQKKTKVIKKRSFRKTKHEQQEKEARAHFQHYHQWHYTCHCSCLRRRLRSHSLIFISTFLSKKKRKRKRWWW